MLLVTWKVSCLRLHVLKIVSRENRRVLITSHTGKSLDNTFIIELRYIAFLILMIFLLVNDCTRKGDYGLIIEALFLRMRGRAFVFCEQPGEYRSLPELGKEYYI